VAGHTIGRPEGRILEAVNLFEQLTAEQLSRHLGYSFRYTQARCKDLADKKYLQRLTLPKRTPGGGVPYVYTLGRRGRDYLSSLDEDSSLPVKKRYRPSEERAQLHTLATNEVLLQVMKITETDPALTLRRFIPEREFQQEPVTVTLPEKDGGQTVSLIPDLWLHVRQRVGDKAYSIGFCIEVNLTPIEQRRWRRKVSMYLNCEDGYTKRVGTKAFRVVTFIASPATVLRRGTGAFSKQGLQERERELAATEKRKKDFLLWTQRELAAQNREKDADLFLFSSYPIDSLRPKKLVFSDHFSMPFEGSQTSLLIS
jgi:hypothetical protein